MERTKKVFPQFEVDDRGDRYFLSTHVRIKNLEDGKWYLKYLTYHFDKDYPSGFSRFTSDCYRDILFGIVGSLEFLNEDDGLPVFTLDELQYSEHGVWYVKDGLMWTKSQPPKFSVKYKLPYADEFLEIYKERYES